MNINIFERLRNFIVDKSTSWSTLTIFRNDAERILEQMEMYQQDIRRLLDENMRLHLRLDELQKGVLFMGKPASYWAELEAYAQSKYRDGLIEQVANYKSLAHDFCAKSNLLERQLDELKTALKELAQ